MNISSLSSSVPTIGSNSSIQPGQVSSASDPDGDGDGRVHKPHGRGGHMHAALTEAFQSLGLTVPDGTSASSSAGSASAGSDSSTSTSGASPAAGNVKQDMHDFMHELFQAVKSESSASPTTTDSGSGGPQSSFADGLSALIAQVGNGSAPAGLQDAFSKLAADLQGSASPSATTDASAGSSSNSSTSTAPTLQALLTNLQQDLGYGKSSTSAIGNSVSALA
jgi:hypothetical protein